MSGAVRESLRVGEVWGQHLLQLLLSLLFDFIAFYLILCMKISHVAVCWLLLMSVDHKHISRSLSGYDGHESNR